MSEKKRSQTKETPQETKLAVKKDPVTVRNVQETKEAGKKDPDVLMYVGPTVTGFAVQNRVYSDIPKEASEVFKVHPELRNLFIPVADYPKANAQLRNRTGYIYEAYVKAWEVRNG